MLRHGEARTVVHRALRGCVDGTRGPWSPPPSLGTVGARPRAHAWCGLRLRGAAPARPRRRLRSCGVRRAAVRSSVSSGPAGRPTLARDGGARSRGTAPRRRGTSVGREWPHLARRTFVRRPAGQRAHGRGARAGGDTAAALVPASSAPSAARAEDATLPRAANADAVRPRLTRSVREPRRAEDGDTVDSRIDPAPDRRACRPRSRAGRARYAAGIDRRGISPFPAALIDRGRRSVASGLLRSATRGGGPRWSNESRTPRTHPTA